MTSEPQADRPAEPVLAVDLDGTLSCTDTLHEAVLCLLRSDPAALLRFPAWIAAGRARFKERVADRCVVPGSALALNPVVIAEIEAARAAGRKVALVTAADQRQAEAAVAGGPAEGLFEEIHGTAAGRNIKGSEKVRFLIERYGAGGFDYIGDHRADLPVWAEARQALTVRADGKLRQAAEAQNSQVRHLDPPPAKLAMVLRALRPHQWSKNLLLFFPALAAHISLVLLDVLVGFFVFCLAASAVYIVNDLMDLADDRAHPRKRHRPFAAGNLQLATGVGLAAVLFFTAFVVAALVGAGFFLTLAIYIGLTFLYSFWLKRELLVDVLMLAALYTIRLVAGGVVAGLMLSPWLLGFSMFVFLSLAMVKRQAELVDQLKTGRDQSGRAYQIDDLPILRGVAVSAATAAVLVLALYIASDDVQPLYANPQILWLVCPMLLYWLLRMVMKTHRGRMTDDPIVYAATDWVSLMVISACAAVVLIAA